MSEPRGLWRHEDDLSGCSSYPDILNFTYVGPDESLVCQHHRTLRCYEPCVLCPDGTDEHPFAEHLARARRLNAAVERVIDLWNGNGGWIPGADSERLAEALGVDHDRLTHWDHEKGERYYPEGSKR